MNTNGKYEILYNVDIDIINPVNKPKSENEHILVYGRVRTGLY